VKTTSERIRELLAEVCAISPESIQVDRPLLEYGLDSARAIDLLVGLEGEFGLTIPDEAATRLKTLGDVIAFIEAQLPKP
jgi:acyl carrier protein